MNRYHNHRAEQSESVQTLLLKPIDAARQLGVSERTLWAQTHPRGPIPCVRIGNCVRYSSDQLRQFIEQQASAAAGSLVGPGIQSDGRGQ